VIFFWIIDDSPNQARTARLLELSAKSVASLIRVSALPILRSYCFRQRPSRFHLAPETRRPLGAFLLYGRKLQKYSFNPN